MRQAQNGKHTSCASASTSGQLHQETDCSKCAQRARTASAAAANSGTQGREVRREASSGPALGAKSEVAGQGCRKESSKILLSPLKKGSKLAFFSPAARISKGGSLRSPQIGHPGGDHHTRHSQGGIATPGSTTLYSTLSVSHGLISSTTSLQHSTVYSSTAVLQSTTSTPPLCGDESDQEIERCWCLWHRQRCDL